MTKSKLSIAMCTFNGAAWLPEQLHSITAQTRRPDEMIICDDGSTDSTFAVLKEFARASAFPVRLVQNPTCLGVAGNFSKAVGLCTGDLIALCDQDDRWGARKLDVLEDRIEQDAALGLVFCNANLVDENLSPIGLRLWDTLYLDPLQRQRLTNGQAMRVLTRTNVVTGATLMFRARFKPVVLPISSNWVHDAWIALIISAVAQCAMVDEPLVDYRQHQRQQIGARKSTLLDQVRIGMQMDREYFRLEALRWREVFDRLFQHRQTLRHPQDLRLLQEKVKFCADRYLMRIDPGQRWDMIRRYWSAGHYREMAWGWKSILQDLVVRT